MPILRDDEACDGGTNAATQQQRDIAHAGLRGRDIADSLEVDGQRVEEGEKPAFVEKTKDHARKHDPHVQNLPYHHCAVGENPLGHDERDRENDEADQKTNDLRRVPGVCDARDLQRSGEADQGS